MKSDFWQSLTVICLVVTTVLTFLTNQHQHKTLVALQGQLDIVNSVLFEPPPDPIALGAWYRNTCCGDTEWTAADQEALDKMADVRFVVHYGKTPEDTTFIISTEGDTSGWIGAGLRQ